MALSLPPQKRKKPTEAEIEAVINRGGDVATSPQIEPDDNSPIHINTRLTRKIVSQIDVLRASRPRKPGSPKLGISLRDWIVEAVIEKLDRDQKRLK